MKDILNEIEADIIDINTKNFQYVATNEVPSRHDTSLTFERGLDKKGKELETCVLYVDIRNSVELTKKHHSLTMGRIYTAFSKAILKIARHHKGHVRNIIGDRVMVVFPKENCYTNALNCAISIYHISHYIINKVFTGVEFKCGIGIDYGILKVIKVGLHRRGSEGFDNKNLVWAGYPANIASRLTDVAHKSVDNSKMRVQYYPTNYAYLFPGLSDLGVLGRRRGLNRFSSISEKPYSSILQQDLLSNEEFVKRISFNADNGVSYNKGKFVSFDRMESKIDFPPILMTSRVFNGYKIANPSSDSITKNFWVKIDNHEIKNVDGDVYGGTVYWKI